VGGGAELELGTALATEAIRHPTACGQGLDVTVGGGAVCQLELGTALAASSKYAPPLTLPSGQ
jgi:hypothetical protein